MEWAVEREGCEGEGNRKGEREVGRVEESGKGERRGVIEREGGNGEGLKERGKWEELRKVGREKEGGKWRGKVRSGEGR